MKKTSLYIDEDRLRAVGTLLGTSSATDTVNRALAEIEAQDKRRQLVERMRNLSETDARAIESSWD
jgi:hypothetical protein